MTIFITSDTHFHHRNILDFEDRPFNTLDDMHKGMIDAWNSVVGKHDIVYHLGDFSLGKPADWVDILDQLKGNFILIDGNHDKDKTVRKVMIDGYIGERYQVGTTIKVDGMKLNLTHYPLDIGLRMNNFSVHGHIHSYDYGKPNNLNVGVDSSFAKSLGLPFGAPIELSHVVNYFNEISPKIEDEFKKQRGL